MQTDALLEHSPEAERIWTVSELNRTVRTLLEDTFAPFWLRGEIGNITIHSSGHVYFSLKDDRSQVSLVFFRGAREARDQDLATGIEVEVYGHISLYEPRGQYQVIVSRIRTRGVGDLQKRFEELKAKLREEGLFDEERKRPIPMLPSCVGVVTSPDGAAIRDVLRVLNRRFAGLHVRIVPTAVQGQEAAPQIAAAINALNRLQACDVIVVTRGGGSLEDLWAFNEEAVARAVAASTIPVISAVGHERDYSICDFAADLRVATPSAAAELVVQARADLLERVTTTRRRIRQALLLRLSELRRRYERAAHSAVFREPANVVRMYQQRLDELALRRSRALQRQCERARARLQQSAGKLDALNPRKVLGRGYAILLDPASGRALRDSAETGVGAKLTGLLARGRVELDVAQVVPADTGGAAPENQPREPAQ